LSIYLRGRYPNSFLVYAFLKKQIKVWISATLFILAAFGLFLRSGYEYGWKVYYSLVVDDLDFLNIVLLTVVYLIFFVVWNRFSKNKRFDMNLFYLLLPLSFALDSIINLFRYTNIEGNNYFGIVLNTFDFVGVRYPEIGIFYMKIPNIVAGALLRFNMEKLYTNSLLCIFFYPLLHVIFALLLTYFLSKSKIRLRYLMILLLTFFFVAHLYWLLNKDPWMIKI